MKVRAVTVGLSLLQDDGGGRGAGQLTPSVKERLKRAANLGNQVKEALEQAGYEVQTVRMCTNPFEAWLETANEAAVRTQIQALDQVLEELGVDFFSIGPCKTLEALRLVPLILQTSPRVSASLSISTNATPDAVVLMEEGARTMLRISREVGSDGLGNFRFCVAFCCRPGIPFFPAAYHDRGSEGQAAGEALLQLRTRPDITSTGLPAMDTSFLSKHTKELAIIRQEIQAQLGSFSQDNNIIYFSPIPPSDTLPPLPAGTVMVQVVKYQYSADLPHLVFEEASDEPPPPPPGTEGGGDLPGPSAPLHRSDSDLARELQEKLNAEDGVGR